MSDNESNDDIDELQELMAEYGVKEEKEKNDKFETICAEVPMDKVLFGDKKGFIGKLSSAVGEKVEVDDSSDKEDDIHRAKKRKPAWTDADDEELQFGEVKRETRLTGPLDHLRKDKTYKDYLTARFTRIVNQPKWATMDKKRVKKQDDDNSEDENLLQTVGFIDRKKETITLRAHGLRCNRLKDMNRSSYAEGLIHSIQFHPTSTAALVSGENGIATIYSIDGHRNDKLHNIRFHNFPLVCTRIAPCGTKAYFGSIKRNYYKYDLLTAQETLLPLPSDLGSFRNFEVSPCGRYIAAAGYHGAIHLLAASTNEIIHTFKQEDHVVGIRFTADSKKLITNGRGCNVCIFSLRQLIMEHRFIDDGCISGSALDLSSNQRMLATGTKEGVVNVYDFENVQTSKAPQPIKTILNLTTGISNVRFNHSSEILAMCSSQTPDAVRLVHFPSATVFANFPSQPAKLGNVRTMEFSPSSGFLAAGTKEGKVPLFRLKHFKNY